MKPRAIILTLLPGFCLALGLTQCQNPVSVKLTLADSAAIAKQYVSSKTSLDSSLRDSIRKVAVRELLDGQNFGKFSISDTYMVTMSAHRTTLAPPPPTDPDVADDYIANYRRHTLATNKSSWLVSFTDLEQIMYNSEKGQPDYIQIFLSRTADAADAENVRVVLAGVKQELSISKPPVRTLQPFSQSFLYGNPPTSHVIDQVEPCPVCIGAYRVAVTPDRLNFNR